MKNFFKGLWSWVTSLFRTADDTFLGVFQFAERIENAVNQTKQTLTDLKSFDFNPAFKTRVISVPRAISGFNDLWAEITQDLREKVQLLSNQFGYWRDKFESRTPSEGAEAASSVTARIQDIHTMLDQIGTSLEAIISIEKIVSDVTHRIETLDDLFLPQDSERTRVKVNYSKRNA